MSVLDRIHGDYVHTRRARVLSEQAAELLPRGVRVLDVGCGDGLLAALIREKRPDIEVTGIDVLVRPSTHISVEPFDGTRIPYADRSVDVVMFVDVLHHASDPALLLREAARTATRTILIKDHTLDGALAGPTLRLMDWIGNARHSVTLPYSYWSHQTWLDACERLGLRIGVWRTNLDLYPWPATWLFDRSLHFVARLDLPDRNDA